MNDLEPPPPPEPKHKSCRGCPYGAHQPCIGWCTRKDAKIIKGKELEREIARLGLFMERYDVEDEDMVVLYNCKNIIEVNGIKYSFGPVIVLHKGESDVECLSESEICGAVIFLMDSEVTLCYDGREFTAFELF